MAYSIDNVKDIIKDILIETNEVNLKKEEMNDDTRFDKDLSFDSFNYIKFVVALEAKLDIVFSIDDLDIDSIKTIQQMAEKAYDIYVNSTNSK